MIYIASPYSHPDFAVMQQRYVSVRKYTGDLLRACVWCYSPIVHCHEIAITESLPTNAAYWKEYNTVMLRKSEGIDVLQLKGWDKSVGVKYEVRLAESLFIPVRYIPADLYEAPS